MHTSPSLKLPSGCHGNYAITHNQNGFIIEDISCLPLSGPTSHLPSVTNAPRNLM